ncbi:MAG: 3-dehydroquinate synthase [Actinomycetaceae bacterium]|nr:3-dehydroquinate synthase [Actinomycetaceae bacterium]
MAPRAIFIGMPGAGKSAVGRRVAAHYQIPFADSDKLIVERAGRSIPHIFEQDGEAGFRKLEEEVIAEALTSFDGVLSLGGGAILSPATRERLKKQLVILIEVEDAELVRRVSRSRTVRPLLQADPAGGIAKLRTERAHFYHQVARHIIYSDQRGVRRVVDAAIKIMENPMRTVKVTGPNPYDVHIGRDLVSSIVHAVGDAPAVMMLHAPDIPEFVARIAEELTLAGINHVDVELPRAEAAKDISVLQKCWDIAGDNRIGRDGVMIAVGGGATTDVGGFIAASWLRGVPVIQVPTTLLGMVDAAVGGKTGINTPAGKNLVGAFHPPIRVVCDTEVLRTLPKEDIRAGMAEVVKCGFIRDPKILEIIDREGEALLDPEHPDMVELIERAIQVKADVVSQDLRESGLREILNYGHTLAHAIERVENYEWRHGEAVAIGCVFAAALAEGAGVAPEGFAKLHAQYLTRLGLPVSYPQGNREDLEAAMYSDKKVRAGELRFLVLTEIAKPAILRSPSKRSMDYAFKAIGVTW